MMIGYWLFVIRYWLLVIRCFFLRKRKLENLELKQQMEVAEKIMREDYNLLKRLADE